MKTGHLSEYFEGVAVKVLSAVEADVLTSNQHEFNGVEGLRDILGEPDGKVRYEARFLYLTDKDDEPVIENGFLTWYDARQKARIERGVMRWEYRLYFPTNVVSQCTNAGDLLVIAKRPDNTLLAIVAEAETTIAQQILWLFGFSDLSHPGFAVREELDTEQDRVEFASRLILESIGIEVESADENWLDRIFAKFGAVFPVTREFSAFARETATDINVLEHPDSAFITWIDHEEMLFRTLEKHIVEKRLENGFTGVDDFISYSLSIQNRRKSRVGHALENHLEHLFLSHSIRYSRGALTENRAKPDFLFPGITFYRNPEFPDAGITMLGVKSTCKDRWRQVLSEAQRIDSKHLFTLEPSISINQTEEMKSNLLQLVLPQHLHETYSDTQRSWLMSLSSFIELVRNKQDKNGITTTCT